MLNYELENEVLTIPLEGRLDTETVIEFDTEVLRLCDETPHTHLVFDATHLQYIASSGLRVVLKMAKREKAFSMVNVNPEVYNVLEMTGFSKIIPVEKALRRIDLDECELIGQGAVGAVYRVSDDEIVKVNFIQAEAQSLVTELTKAKEAFLLGVPTAISFDLVDCGEGKRGVIYETIKSKTLGETVQAHPERMEELAAKYVAQLRALHAIHTHNPAFDSAKAYYRKMLDGVSKHLTQEETDKLAMLLEALPEGDALVHGDAHTKNIMMQGDEMYWIDMEMMCVGHPVYDLIAIAAALKITMSDEVAIKLAGMDVGTLERFYKSFIRHYFGAQTEEEVAKYDALMGMLRMVRRVFVMGMDTPMIIRSRAKTLDDLRIHLFPHIEQVIGGVRELVELTMND